MGKQPRSFRERRVSIALAMLAGVVSVIALPSVAAPISAGALFPSSASAAAADQAIGAR